MDREERRPPKHDGLAIASLVLALVWAGGIGSVLAIVFGAVSELGAHRDGRKASALALAGQLLGLSGIIGTLIILHAST